MTSLRNFARSTEPHCIILARGRHVHSIIVTPRLVGLCSAAGFILAAWLIGATTFLVFHNEIGETLRFYHVEKERRYEDRIASLRRQIDEINSRQFLDQQTMERKLAALRRKQAALEARQVQISGLFEDARERDLSIRIDDGAPGQADSTLRTGSVTRAGLTGPAGVRPYPAPGEPETLAIGRGDPAGSTLDELDASIDRLAAAQDEVLAGFEKSIHHTIETLAAVPQAIGLPVPEGEGVGGPFVELRSSDQAMADDDGQIERIARAMGRIDALKSHLSRLPVRRPLGTGTMVTSGYGTRLDPFLRRPAMHTGIDFRAKAGTPVHAVAAGRVTRAGRFGGYGNLVEIDHGNGYSTRYAHMNSVSVRRGQSVEPGDVVGEVGSTGRSTGPHLHYETRLSGRPRNPKTYLEAAKLLPDGF